MASVVRWEGVLSVGKLTPGSDRYYEEVAHGAEDYYADRDGGEEDALGEWLGAGAGALGLRGTVADGQLAELIAGRDPLSGQALRRGIGPARWVRRGGDGRAVGAGPTTGFDLTFSAPKSVSVLYGVTDEEVRGRVREAHDAAVRDAVGYMERQAAVTRRGAQDDRVRGVGLVAAAYRHVASRAGDPQLHTHVVVANATLAEGRWSTLDGRAVYAHAKTGGYVYQASLRAHLTDVLGVRWADVRNGVAEIDGIDRSVIEEFSRRRAEVLEAMAVRGEHSPRAAQTAVLQTRRAKDYAVTSQRLREDWQARAAEHGLGRDELLGLTGRPPRVSSVETARTAAVLAGPTGLTERASTFTRRNVVQAWSAVHPDGATVAQVERLADRWLASSHAVALEPGVVLTGDEQLAAPADMGERYSTPDMLAAERRLVELAGRRTGEGAGVASEAAVESALAERPSISGEQAAMVRALTSSGDGVQVVRGWAGTGKTFALDACREAWEATDTGVFGCAVAGKAAQGLADETGMETSTIARLLADLRDGHTLAQGSVVVVDEAGMAGTRTLLELAEHADRANAKLVLVGDDGQLPEIDAGGAFRSLAARPGAIELTEVRRQRDAADVVDLRRIREGDADQALDGWRERGLVALGRTTDETRDLMVRDWWRDHQGSDGSAVMLARRNSDVRDLNRRARDTIRAHGQLDEQELHIGSRAFAAGDRVIAGRNAPRLGVMNGTLGTVTDVREDGLSVRTDAGAQVKLPLDYIAGVRDDGRPQLDHAYAITVHRAQGATFDRTYVLGSDDSYREEAYTALSRHRHEARFYVTAPDVNDPGERVDPLQAIKAVLGTSRAKKLAIDTTDPPLRALSDERLADEAVRLRRVLDTFPRAADRALDRVRDDAQRAAAHYAETSERLDRLELTRARARRRDAPQLDAAIDGARRAREHAHAEVRQLAGVRDAVIDQAGDPDAWLRRHQPHLQRLAAVEREHAVRQQQRAEQALRAVTIDPSSRVTDALGPRPERPSQRAGWDRAARQLELRHHDPRPDPAPEPGARRLRDRDGPDIDIGLGR